LASRPSRSALGKRSASQTPFHPHLMRIDCSNRRVIAGENEGELCSHTRIAIINADKKKFEVNSPETKYIASGALRAEQDGRQRRTECLRIWPLGNAGFSSGLRRKCRLPDERNVNRYDPDLRQTFS
jgi:hypothetical protein